MFQPNQPPTHPSNLIFFYSVHIRFHLVHVPLKLSEDVLKVVVEVLAKKQIAQIRYIDKILTYATGSKMKHPVINDALTHIDKPNNIRQLWSVDCRLKSCSISKDVRNWKIKWLKRCHQGK